MHAMLKKPKSMGFFNSRIARPGMKETAEHRIGEYQLEFCDTDGGVTYIDGVAYPVRKNMLICAKPGQRRWTRLPFCCYYIKIDKSDSPLDGMLSSTADCWMTTEEKMESFLQAFHRLTESEGMSEMHYFGALLSLLADVAEDSRQSYLRREREGENEKACQISRSVRMAEQYMNENFKEKCSLETVAKKAGFSPIYFHKLFKEKTGLSPNEYLLRKRLFEAEERLARGDMPLSEIAEECGFGSQSYFQYVFKREKGMTPTAYRKKEQRKYLDICTV